MNQVSDEKGSMKTQKPIYQLLIQSATLLTQVGVVNWAANFSDFAEAYLESDSLAEEKQIPRQPAIILL